MELTPKLVADLLSTAGSLLKDHANHCDGFEGAPREFLDDLCGLFERVEEFDDLDTFFEQVRQRWSTLEAGQRQFFFGWLLHVSRREDVAASSVLLLQALLGNDGEVDTAAFEQIVRQVGIFVFAGTLDELREMFGPVVGRYTTSQVEFHQAVLTYVDQLFDVAESKYGPVTERGKVSVLLHESGRVSLVCLTGGVAGAPPCIGANVPERAWRFVDAAEA